MAYYFLYPEKDTTIYSHPLRQDLNTGIVENLELTSEKGVTSSLYYPSRFLVQFKDTEINNIINNKISGSFSASLKSYSTEYNQNLTQTQTIEIAALAESWVNGTGRYNTHPSFTGITSDGCSWLYNDNGTDKTSWETSSFSANTTGSFSGSNKGGGVWYTGSGFEYSQSFSLVNDFDLDIDITNTVIKHYSSSYLSSTYPNGITNNGFIIKRVNDVYNNTTDQGTLKYFSLDTNTIFSPTLAIKWDDSSYITSSGATILNSGKIQMNINNNKKVYRNEEEYTFRFTTRKQYPVRKFVTSSNYLDINYLTTASYYSIEDYTSKETIIPFDTSYTKLSADSEGMYFKLYMNGLQPERYYKILIRHDNNDGITIYDDNYYFKVTR
jgi:hypothetical protein